MFMAGRRCRNVDTFDYKPRLQSDDGKAVGGGKGNPARKLLKSPFKFSQHGQSRLWLPETLPNLARHADELCVLNGMYTDLPAHAQATVEMHTGNFRFLRPSMGAWMLYGLGTENTNLPGFVTHQSDRGAKGAAELRQRVFARRFFPGNAISKPVLARARRGGVRQHFREPATLGRAAAQASLDLLATLNRERLERDRVNPGLEGVIESYELAFRMEGAIPQVMDLSARRPRPPRMRTGSAREGPIASAGNACSPAASPRPASASSRSAPAAGTITTNLQNQA